MNNKKAKTKNSNDINLLLDKNNQKTALNAFFKLAEKWDLKPKEARALLGNPRERTYYNWRNGTLGSVPADTIRRISYLLGIHKALRILYRNPENLYGWIRQPNELLNGQSPIDRMAAGDMTDIAFIRNYIDSVRG